jgi:biotin transport system substrate-specific component
MTQTPKAKALTSTSSRTRSIVFVALSVAIIAVSAWVTVPIGPVPVTLQMFAIAFCILVLTPKQAMAAIVCYILLGAIGVPVFSGMRGGFGVLAGPTGGYIWGFVIAVAVASAVLALFRSRNIDNLGIAVLVGMIFTVVAYACGLAQYMAVAHVDFAAAFAVTVAPFVLIDLGKVVCAAIVARAVVRALPSK